jgi:hypothetical protein
MNRTVLIALIPVGLLIAGVSTDTTSQLGWVTRILGLILLIVAVAGLAVESASAPH